MYKYWDNDKLEEVRVKAKDVITDCLDQIKDGDIIYVNAICSGMGGSPELLEKRRAVVQDGRISYEYLRERYSFNRETGVGRNRYIVCWQPHDGRKIIKDDINFEI